MSNTLKILLVWIVFEYLASYDFNVKFPLKSIIRMSKSNAIEITQTHEKHRKCIESTWNILLIVLESFETNNSYLSLSHSKSMDPFWGMWEKPSKVLIITSQTQALLFMEKFTFL